MIQNAYSISENSSKEYSSSWEANSCSPTHEIIWNPRVITELRTARQLILPWARLIQSTSPHPIYLRSILISSSHLPLGRNRHRSVGIIIRLTVGGRDSISDKIRGSSVRHRDQTDSGLWTQGTWAASLGVKPLVCVKLMFLVEGLRMHGAVSPLQILRHGVMLN
jgi:hypothetical protein